MTILEKQVELNEQLLRRMSDEVAVFRLQIEDMKPEQFLLLSYKYTVYTDILYILEHNLLSIEQAQAMLNSEHPLEDVWSEWQRYPSNHYEELWKAIELTASSRLHAEKLSKRFKEEKSEDAR